MLSADDQNKLKTFFIGYSTKIIKLQKKLQKDPVQNIGIILWPGSKNPAHGRHLIARCVLIVAPNYLSSFFLGGGAIGEVGFGGGGGGWGGGGGCSASSTAARA